MHEAVQLDFRAIDLEEESKIEQFLSTTCDCLKACIKQFTRKHVKLTRENAALLSRSDLDMALLGQIMSSTHCTSSHRNSLMIHINKSRGMEIVLYFTTKGKNCRNTFLFLHTIVEFRLKAAHKARNHAVCLFPTF